MKNLIPIEYFLAAKEVVEYNGKSPSGIVWKYTKQSGNLVHTVKGEPAGYYHTNRNSGKSYWVLKVNGKSIKVSRLIYFMQNDDFQIDLVIDHIDGNSLNNNLENLRLVTRNRNAQNRKITQGNLSGTLGVRKARVGNLWYWEADIRIDGRKFVERFSIKKLGDNLAKQLAEDKRKEFVTLANEKGACFKTFD